MSDEQFQIRWKGKIFGPYKRREIERKIREHELGMFHEIRVENEWLTLKEFLGPASAPPSPDDSPASETEAQLPSPAEPPSPAPSPWLLTGYAAVLALLATALLGWTETWTAPSGAAPLLGLGLGLGGAFAALVSLFQGEKKHGIIVLVLSIFLSFANMMLA